MWFTFENVKNFQDLSMYYGNLLDNVGSFSGTVMIFVL
jgi:hypothetical protein